MTGEICKKCGGCALRGMEESSYRQMKTADFEKTLSFIRTASPVFDSPVFIRDGLRRRADMSFSMVGKELLLGFNESQTHNLVDVTTCPMLLPELNSFLPDLRKFLTEFCSAAVTVKNKKKIEKKYIRTGSVKILNADNGIDILLELPFEPALEHRLQVADFVNGTPALLRLSWRIADRKPETVVAKSQPELYIAGCAVVVPQGSFLQASKPAETAMIRQVLTYLGDTTGKMVDLFCGLGTFTYPLAADKRNEIVSADASAESLEGLKATLNRNGVPNVSVVSRNLFKNPFDETELKGLKALIIDPPRAGAHEQCRMIAQMPEAAKPEKIIFISCNPKTFVYDAGLLIEGGYMFSRVTFIDQFVYSKHQELIALFVLNSENKKE